MSVSFASKTALGSHGTGGSQVSPSSTGTAPFPPTRLFPAHFHPKSFSVITAIIIFFAVFFLGCAISHLIILTVVFVRV